MQFSNPRRHHIYKKSEECIFKGFKIDQNQIKLVRQGHLWTGKWIQEHRKTSKSQIVKAPLMGLKLNPRASESMKISNPRGHNICKKPEECIFKDFKIVLQTFDTDQNQKEITR